MELDQLRYFIEVAETKNLTRAAEKLHIAQSAVSRQIILLEEEFSQKLFERSRCGMILTDAGQRFFKRAVDIIDIVETTAAEMSEKGRLEREKR